MSQTKNITINPDDFQFAGKTRKKRPANEKPIRIKSAQKSAANHDKTLKKRSILNMIRQHQEKYKKQFDDAAPKPDAEVAQFDDSFEKSKEFFEKMIENDKQLAKTEIHANHTLKNYASLRSNPTTPVPQNLPKIDKRLSEMVDLGIPADFHSQPAMQLKTPLPQAKYGCLKNGTLPTYRQYHNLTLKNAPTKNNLLSPASYLKNIEDPEDLNRRQAKMEWKQTQDLLNKGGQKPRRMKQKKTIRRTFKTGKQKTAPKVCVLVSNKTIRNNIVAKSHLLKQTPIADVKNYLVKHGFIRVGSTAPNDVLRKMYESASLICGEIKNHNEDNLLFNYLNAEE
jgi:hypothetical protein